MSCFGFEQHNTRQVAADHPVLNVFHETETKEILLMSVATFSTAWHLVYSLWRGSTLLIFGIKWLFFTATITTAAWKG